MVQGTRMEFFGLFTVRPGVDSIALDDAGEWLYFAPVTNTHLYRVRTADLHDPRLSWRELESPRRALRREDHERRHRDRRRRHALPVGSRALGGRRARPGPPAPHAGEGRAAALARRLRVRARRLALRDVQRAAPGDPEERRRRSRRTRRIRSGACGSTSASPRARACGSSQLGTRASSSERAERRVGRERVARDRAPRTCRARPSARRTRPRASRTRRGTWCRAARARRSGPPSGEVVWISPSMPSSDDASTTLDASLQEVRSSIVMFPPSPTADARTLGVVQHHELGIEGDVAAAAEAGADVGGDRAVLDVDQPAARRSRCRRRRRPRPTSSPARRCAR